ncbi:MAG TPA: hypothetical protein VIK80_10750 [Flavihumibacter sp.]|jgi:hypothetical protein
MIKLLFLVLIPVFSFGQKKGDTKIVLDTVNMDKIILSLFENAYTIDTNDEKLKLLTTKTKDIGSIGVRIRIMQKDSVMILSGEVVDRALMIVLASSEPIYSTIQFGGMKGSTRRQAWNELLKVASGMGKIIRFE